MDPPESSAEVRAFYERHPYPAPVTDLSGYRERWEQGERRQAAFHVLWPEEPYRDDLEVLVTGCGTSQAAKHAALELLRSTMVKHEFVAYSDVKPFGFDSDRWLDYVPLRNPDAITVKERLPAGAVAVLLNPMHTHTDIILPTDESEERLLEAIDGNRSINNIFQLVADDPQDDASQRRAFEYFQQLWRHDQIVLNASRT
jgi:hypothetical protein